MNLNASVVFLAALNDRKSKKPLRSAAHAALLCGLAGFLLGVSQQALAQDSLNQVGAPSFTTALPVESGFLNVANGNLHQAIPLGSFPQRGARPYVAELVYDSRIWQIVTGSSNTWQPTNVANSQGGWRFVTSADVGFVSAGPGRVLTCGALPNRIVGGTSISGFTWTDSSGVQHGFPIGTFRPEPGDPCNFGTTSSGDAFATDASGYHMFITNFTSAVVYAPDGTLAFPTVQDTNGNSFARDANQNVIDTLGRTPIIKTVNGSTTTYSILNSQGSSSNVTVTTETINVSTAFGVSGVTEFSGTLTVIQKITLPDNTFYSFGYDSYGLLNSVTLPTGGQITYGYTNFTDALGNTNRWVTSRTSDGGNWSYTPKVTVSCATGGSTCTQTVAIPKPSGDETDYTFTLNNGSWVSNTESFSGSHASGTLLASTSTTWDFSQACSPSPCTGASNIRKLITTTTLGQSTNVVTSQRQLTYADSNTSNVGSIKEWKFVSGVSLPSTPDRETDFAYLGTSTYTGKNIINRPTSQTVKDGSGYTIALTNYAYDGSSLTSVTGVKNHDDTNFGTGNTTRGNLTQVKRCIDLSSSCSTFVATTLSYDTTGQVTQAQDAAGNAATFGYTDNFFTDNGANPPASFIPSAPTNAYLTSLTQPLIGTSAFGYYYNTGKRASSKDPNGGDGFSHFLDPLDRLTNAYGPVAPTGSRPWTLAIYAASETQVDSYTGIIDSAPSASCTSCRHDQVMFDNLGRITTQTLVNDPEGATSVTTSYDTTGRVQNSSHPSRSTNDTTYGLETPTYDGLGRVIKMTHQDGTFSQSFYGAAVSAAGGRTSQLCPAATCGVGFPTLAKDEAGKMRQTWTDGFGRLIEVDEPTLTAATPGQGSASVSGNEQATGGTPATSGSGTITINGTEQSTTITYVCGTKPNLMLCHQTVYNSGTVTITVNGFAASATYGQASTAQTVASSLNTALNGSSSPVTSTVSSAVLTLTAKATGAATNYSLSTSSTYDSSHFSGPSFTAALPSGSALSGGADAKPPTIFDSGSVWVTVNGTQATASYGQGDTTASVAQKLQTAMASLPVTVSLSGSTLNLTAKTNGSATNYSLSAGSSTSQPGTFSSPSFTVSVSGPSLTGGTDPAQTLATAKATQYIYDLLGNLTQVAQGSQTRKFTYDTLSRVTQATTPETGATPTKYFYTTSAGGLCSGSPGVVCYSIDPRGITKTFSYDTLNRLTGVSYSDTTPAVTYSYDQGTNAQGQSQKGFRTGMTDGSGSTIWTNDLAGRVLTERLTIAGITKTVSYAYNLDGSIAKLTYPSGRQVAYTVSNAQRLTSAKDLGTNTQYATAASYAPIGALQGVITGQISGGFTGITESHSYNNRLEYIGTQATSTTGTALNLGLGYSIPGGNNGSVASITNNVDNGRNETIQYDQLNRITLAATQATTGTDCWGQSFGIDALSNLTAIGLTQCPGGSLSMATDGNNHLTSLGYDAAGNTTGDGAYTYTFDAENRITSAAGVNYTYDGNGLRVKKSNGTLYWRSISGDTLAETDLSGNTISEYVFISGRRVARLDASANVFYYFLDPLGNTRTITDATGHVCYDADFTPYGQEINHTNSCPQNYKFTGYERDPETGNDYAFARYYSPRLGRFMTPDPLGGGIDDPQSLNRYAYVRNDPMNLADPSGLCTRCKEADSGSGNPFGGWDVFSFLGIPVLIGFNVTPGAVTIDPEFMATGLVSQDFTVTPIYGSAFGLFDLGSGAGASQGGGGKARDVIKAALGQKNLSTCLHKFFGPGKILTNSNLPSINATENLTNGAAGQTRASEVPDTGRGSVYIDKGIFTSLSANDPFLVGTYLHEVANVLAIQLFTNVQPRWARARMGPRGTYPTQDQINDPTGDPDIGQQFEECIFP